MDKTRGFVTIATGQERYFKLARNLLFSYRQFSSEKYPFALICDKENDCSAEFDDVVILEEPHCNYLDKLSLYEVLPYDETIFIDADSLAYGDLDAWWKIFEAADDFSVFGYMWQDLSCGRGWFLPDGIREFRQKVSYVPDFNGGVYFMRRGETCRKVFELANYFAEHYKEYAFTGFTKPADEPCLALAMAVCQCKTIDLPEIAFAPRRGQIEADISQPRAHYYRKNGQEYDVRLIHWSNYKTRQSLYIFETEHLLRVGNGTAKGIGYDLMYQKRLRYYMLKPMDIAAFCGRVYRKLKRMIRQG